MRGREFFKRKAGKRDGNHAAIRDGLRALGHFVIDTAGVGDGVPDLLVYRRHWYAAIHPVWLELKTRVGRERSSQRAWHACAKLRGLSVVTVRTLDEALEALR